MSKPDPCFLPLYRAIEKLSVHVNWKIVPDFYEAGYLMLQQNCLFIDRDENVNMEQFSNGSSISTDLITVLPLEDGAFMLFCCLLTKKEENKAIHVLHKALSDK